mgnify:CR=1 FL=1
MATGDIMDGLQVHSRFVPLAEDTHFARKDLLDERARRSVDLPLKYWRQQAHFTTPASGAPGKAIRGLKPVKRLLEKFAISPEDIATQTGAPLDTLREVLDGDDHSPFVMVDVEDAVALTEESISKARLGAVRCFTQEDWGPTLPFFRPSGLRLPTCVEDFLTVLPECAADRAPADFPIAGIVWPKTEHPSEIAWVCELLTKIERELQLDEDQIKLEFLVESAHGLDQLGDLARTCAHRLVGIIWGIADYSADVNLPRIDNYHPMCDWARHEIVNVTGAYGVPAIDNMTLNYPTPLHRAEQLSAAQIAENKTKVLGALKEAYDDARHGIELGMTGKWVGHPLQLLMVLAAYRNAIPKKQIEKDINEIEAYTRSVVAGAGATVLGEGAQAYMADRATDRHLRARLRRATAWGRLDAARALALGVITESERATI